MSFFLYTSFIPIERIKVSSKFLLIPLYSDVLVCTIYYYKTGKLTFAACIPGEHCPNACPENCQEGCTRTERCLGGCLQGWRGPRCDERKPLPYPLHNPPPPQFKNLKFKKHSSEMLNILVAIYVYI